MKKRFSEEQIIGFLREAEAGLPVKELCRRHGFSEASYYLWRSKFGAETGPSYHTLDVRAKYVKELPVGQLEFFVDIFNVLNKQSATSHMALVDGNGVYDFGQPNDWVEPRRAYLGVRYSF